jgi:Periplasmic copper-binding protein (NosD)
MKSLNIAIKTFVFAAIIFGATALVNAQATRTWVSGIGADDNPCSRTAPCKTFAGAISKTATNGEINCLDPAGYGAVTITKSITIDCEDTQGSILASLTNGVIINMAPADVKKAVRLRGISINGANTGLTGVKVLAALNSLVLQEVVLDGFTLHGVSIETTSGNLEALIDHTTIRNNAGHAINSFPVGSTADITVNMSTLSNNTQNGLNFADNTTAAISDSVVSGNGIGLLASNAQIFASRCTISKNTTGVQAQSGGTVRLFGNTITKNGTGLSGSTIVAITGTNALLGNTAEGAATFAPPL